MISKSSIAEMLIGQTAYLLTVPSQPIFFNSVDISLVSCKRCKQSNVSRPLAEAKYRVMVLLNCKLLLLKCILESLRVHQTHSMLVFCGPKSAIHIFYFTRKNKNIEVVFHFMYDEIIRWYCKYTHGQPITASIFYYDFKRLMIYEKRASYPLSNTFMILYFRWFLMFILIIWNFC